MDQLCTSGRKRVAAQPVSPEELRKVESLQSEQSEAEEVDEAHAREDIPGTSAGTDAFYITRSWDICTKLISLYPGRVSYIINRKLDTRGGGQRKKMRGPRWVNDASINKDRPSF